MPMHAAVLGRRPIVDRANNTVGYQLALSDQHGQPPAPGATNAAQDGRVLFTPDLSDSALRRLTGDALAFVRADEEVVTGRTGMAWPRTQVVIEVSGADMHRAEFHQGCAALRQSGYRVAVTDVDPDDDMAALCESVDILSVDIRVTSHAELQQLATLCHGSKTQLRAYRVDTPEYLAQAQLGRVDLFQGFAIGRPPTISSNALNPSQHNALRLASSVLRPDAELGAMEKIVRADPALTYQLLQIASVGRLGEARRSVRSIRDALVLMGIERLRGWVPALMLRPAGRAIDSRLPTVLARARTVEILASGRDPDTGGAAFAAGMLSAFDLLLTIDTASIADALDIPPGLRDDAFGEQTSIARIVGDVTAHERGLSAAGLTKVGQSGAGAAEIADAAARGFGWALGAASAIDESVVI